MTERQEAILTALLVADGPMTPNAIAGALGFHPAPSQGGLGGGRGSGAGTGAAQRVIFSLTSLRKQGLVYLALRPDGLSGTAYDLTAAGRLQARRP